MLRAEVADLKRQVVDTRMRLRATNDEIVARLNALQLNSEAQKQDNRNMVNSLMQFTYQMYRSISRERDQRTASIENMSRRMGAIESMSRRMSALESTLRRSLRGVAANMEALVLQMNRARITTTRRLREPNRLTEFAPLPGRPAGARYE